MSETTVNAAPGWFGKMPGAGDFVSRRLPTDFVQHWDAWLQQGLAHTRGALGTGWIDAYLVAPVLRFWTAPGVLGPAAWGGVVMPSVDRVGRHFPLTVAQPVATLAHALAAGAWYGAIDAAARTVLHRDAQIDHLDHELALAGAADGAPDSDQTQHAARLLQLHGENARCTVWWCSDTAGPAAARCFVGLPPPAAFLDALGAHAP